MNDIETAWYKSAILLLNSYFLKIPEAVAIFESAEWRRTILFKAKQIEKELNKDTFPRLGLRDDLTDDSDSQMPPLEMLVAGRSGARLALKDIRGWLRGAQMITICDPYIMYGSKSGLYASDDAYVTFLSSLIPKSAKVIKVFGSGFKAHVKRKLLTSLKEGRTVTFFDTTEIHDRYIIKDLSEGRMIGTSFGGMGNKIFTVLPLPEEDLEVLKKYLKRIEQNEPLSE